MSSTPISNGHANAPIQLTEIVDNILHLVSQTLGVRLSMVTRLEGSTATVSAIHDTLENLQPGMVFPFEDTFCAQMLKTGESCIPDVESAAPAIRRLPAVLELDVASYIGVPISLSDGQIYGTLCALDEQPRQWTPHHLQTLKMLARLLAHELTAESAQRSAERAQQFGEGPHFTDPLTGLITGPAFESHLRSEERRLRRYGGLYSIAMLDLQNLPDSDTPEGEAVAHQLIQGLANTLMLNSRIVDCCARLDGGKFAVLFPETPAKNIPAWLRRIDAAVRTWNLLHPALGVELSFSIGTADSQEAEDYQAVWARAAERMVIDQARQVSLPEATYSRSDTTPQRRRADRQPSYIDEPATV